MKKGNQAVCACGEGFELQSDGESCKGEKNIENNTR